MPTRVGSVGSWSHNPALMRGRQSLDLAVMTDTTSRHRVLQLQLEKVGMCKGAFCADRPAEQDGPRPCDVESLTPARLSRVRIWNRVSSADEVSALYSADTAPSDGLVAEFLLNADTEMIAIDTAQGNNGKLFGASWDVQA